MNWSFISSYLVHFLVSKFLFYLIITGEVAEKLIDADTDVTTHTTPDSSASFGHQSVTGRDVEGHHSQTQSRTEVKYDSSRLSNLATDNTLLILPMFAAL